MGYGRNILRLPLCPMDRDLQAKLFGLMKAEGIQIQEEM